MRLLLLLAVLLAAILVWYARTRRLELERRLETERFRAERQARLDQAASAVQVQAETARSVASRIKASSAQLPAALCDSVDAVIVELDGVAADLRNCHPVPAMAPQRRSLLSR